MKKILFLTVLILSLNAFSQRGKDGALTVTNPNTIVNAFTTLSVDAVIGNSSITVANSTLNLTGLGNLEQGDLIMIYQVQGADVEDDPNFPQAKFFDYWGEVTGYNNCGNYEFLQVENVPNNTTIEFDCGLTNGYTANGKVIIVRVPRYSSLTVNNGGILTTLAWNGNIGGVLAVEVNGLTTINTGGSINATGLGFRGGQAVNGTQSSLYGGLRYADPNGLEGAEKGEGIAGDQIDYDNFNNGGARYCRGAAGNAGGGGNTHNAGGGGGANAGDITAWNKGVGNPDLSTPNFITAWSLDTSYTPVLLSSGGGRGGYSILKNNLNELTNGPNNPSWGGDERRDNGGLGGRPLDYSTGKLFLGGGGGAGEGDNGDASDGGNGGGLIFLTTYGNITGAGNIISNGDDGDDVDPGSAGFGQLEGVDGVGGAGGGGTIVLQTTANVSINAITANGGNGGNQVLVAGFAASIDEAEGPGGGGGGGYIAITSGTPTRNANGGINGVTNSPYVSNFPANGATIGGVGLPNESINAFDILVDNDTICTGNTSTLTATISGTLPSGSSVEWYDAEYSGNLVFTGNSFTTPTLTTNTTYYIKVCPSTFTIPVTVFLEPCAAPVASFSANDSTICVGDCIDFTDLTSGIIPNGWSWYFFGAVTTSSISQNPTNICYNNAGSFDVALVATDGSSNDSLFIPNFITVTSNDNAVFNYTSGSYCLTDPDPTATITGTAGGTFSIDNGGTINNTTGEINITTSGVGAYVVTYITNGSCPDTATFNISIVNSADATINHVGPLCINAVSTTLTAAGAGGTWTGTGITNGTNGTFDPATAGVGNHLITYTISGSCGDIDTMTITVNLIDNPSFTYAATTFCDTDINPIPTSISTTGGTFSIDNSGTINPTTGEVDLSVSGTGSYVITYTTVGLCSNSDTLSFTINNCSTAPLGVFSASNTNTCSNECVDYMDLSSGGIPTSWNWYFEGGSPSTSTQQTPINICYNTEGVFGVSLVVSNAFGTDSIYIPNFMTVDSCNVTTDVLIIPNVFSPNGDGVNDLFKPNGNNITNLYMAVYNRWGELLYESEQLNSGWDGRTTSAAICPEGTYFYLMEINGETHKGTVTMLR